MEQTASAEALGWEGAWTAREGRVGGDGGDRTSQASGRSMWALLSVGRLPEFRLTESVLYQQPKTVRGAPEGWELGKGSSCLGLPPCGEVSCTP